MQKQNKKNTISQTFFSSGLFAIYMLGKRREEMGASNLELAEKLWRKNHEGAHQHATKASSEYKTLSCVALKNRRG